jgi:cytochrome c oxidase cbb3-type subunit 3
MMFAISPARKVLAATLTVSVLGLAGCWREERTYRPGPESAEAVRWTRQSELRAGGDRPDDPRAPIRPVGPVANAYEENAYALSEGKRLFSAFNCNGCHAHGGGDIGPPLIDDKWIYGHDPEQVFGTIVEGRPNGMPSFGGRIPEYQIWWIVAYVRSMSGLASKGAATGRDDHMRSNPPENSQGAEKPVNSSVPRAAEGPL